MRDPNRISKFLSLVEAGWKKFPDMRFGQLIENLKRYTGKDDIFYIEDEQMEKYIKDYFDLDDKVSIYGEGDTCPACGAYTYYGGLCTNCQRDAGVSKGPHEYYENRD